MADGKIVFLGLAPNVGIEHRRPLPSARSLREDEPDNFVMRVEDDQQRGVLAAPANAGWRSGPSMPQFQGCRSAVLVGAAMALLRLSIAQ
jgi:hypothetical protein